MATTLTFQLREAAKRCSNIDYRAQLRSAAAWLVEEAKNFWDNPARENLTALNGAWSHAERVLKNVPPEADPAPLSGSTEPARLAA